MEIYKTKLDKRRKSSFILIVFIALFLILSFSSINNAYAVDSEIVTSMDDSIYRTSSIYISDSGYSTSSSYMVDLDYRISSINTLVTFEDKSSSIPNSKYQITTLNSQSSNSNSNKPLSDSVIYGYLNDNYPPDNYKNDNHHESQANEDNLKKEVEKNNAIDFIDFNSFYYTIQYIDSNSNNFDYYSKDISDYIDSRIVFLAPNSNLKGNGFDNHYNFLKELVILNFNKLDNEEYTSIIQNSQSAFKQTFTILFFIKIFMEYHDNGKEHLNSF